MSEKLGEVVVFARRPMKSIGVQKTTVDTLVLHRDVAVSMAEILSQNSTMFVKSYGRATESTAEFRGTSASHTQVTWNGMKINSPMLGTVDFSLIPSFLIDDVSLYHGASSLGVTGGGLGGAVQLSSAQSAVTGRGLKYVQGIGSFDTFDQFLDLHIGSDRFSSSTKAVYSTSRNNYKYTNYDKKVDVFEDGVLVGSYHPVERNKSGYFDDFHFQQRFGYRANQNTDAGITFWQTVSKRGLPFLSVDYKDDSDFTNEQRVRVSRVVADVNHRAAAVRLSGNAGYSYTDLKYDYFTKRQQEVASDITHSRTYANTAFTKVSADWMPHGGLMLGAVAEGYYNHVKSRDKSTYHIGDNYDKGRVETSLSLSARWRPVERFAVACILRGESYGGHTVPLIPALFVEYTLVPSWNLTAKASVARNYRYPSLDDLYFQPGGNPALDPEKGTTVDGGVEFDYRNDAFTLRGNVSAFDSHIDDWIQWTPDTRGFWRPANVKKVHSYGVEVTASVSVALGNGVTIGADGSFAWTPSINLGEKVNSNDASYGKQLCYVPKFSASVSPKVTWRGWTAVWNWNHYSERFTTASNEVAHITGRLKPYYMNDLCIGKEFAVRKVGFAVKGFVKNIFDTEYVTVLSRPMPGRNYEIMLEVQFDMKQK